MSTQDDTGPTITDLQRHLMQTLRGLRDGSTTIEQARAVSDVAQTLVNVAKVEVEYLRVTGVKRGSGFLPDSEDVPPLPNGIVGVRRHLLRDD
jgi:hypothetical protein